MGNAVPPRMCREVSAATSSVVRRRRPNQNVVANTGFPHAAAADTARKLQPEVTARARKVSWAGGVGADGDDDAGGKASAATVATVKIVLRRKDAEALVARLNAQSTRERKARMAEIKGELRAGECCGGGGASPASCRDAWKPMLAPIKEN